MRYLISLSVLILLAGCSGSSNPVSHVVAELSASHSNQSNVGGPPPPPSTIGTQETPVTLTATLGGSLSPFDGTENLVFQGELEATATPYDGYRFDHWNTNNKNDGSTANPQVFEVLVGLKIEAVFVQVVAN